MNDSDKAGSGAGKEPWGQEDEEWAVRGLGPDNEPEDDGAGWDWGDSPVVPAFILGVLVTALVLGLTWGFTNVLDDGDSESAGDTSSQARSRLGRCATAEGRVGASLKAADPAMQQWQVHVVAMNKLVAGDITLRQASAFWDQTRVAAKRKIRHFEDATRPIRRSGLDCPAVDRLGQASKRLRACASRVDAGARAVDLAGTAIRTWAAHVKDMDMLKMGHLSPAKATQAWLASWQRGVRQVQAYERAARAARPAGDC